MWRVAAWQNSRGRWFLPWLAGWLVGWLVGSFRATRCTPTPTPILFPFHGMQTKRTSYHFASKSSWRTLTSRSRHGHWLGDRLHGVRGLDSFPPAMEIFLCINMFLATREFKVRAALGLTCAKFIKILQHTLSMVQFPDLCYRPEERTCHRLADLRRGIVTLQNCHGMVLWPIGVRYFAVERVGQKCGSPAWWVKGPAMKVPHSVWSIEHKAQLSTKLPLVRGAFW